MFEAGVPLDTDRELREASENAFAVLRAAAEKLVALMPLHRTPAGADGGVARLVDDARHRFAVRPRRFRVRRALPMPPEELLEAAVLIYLRGFRVAAHR